MFYVLNIISIYYLIYIIYLRFTLALHRKPYIWRMWNRVVLARLSAHRILVKTAVIVPIVGVTFTANANVLTSVTLVSTT